MRKISRRTLVLSMTMVLVVVGTAPAFASTASLDGPNPAIWLSDPEGNDGTNGIERGDPIVGSSGTATVNNDGATIKVKATGLEPGHTYTMWVVFFSDQTACSDGCDGGDLVGDANGVTYGAGAVVGSSSGNATFVARLNSGHVGSLVPGIYEAGADNEFHVVIRSHGPKIPGTVDAQTHEFQGGCTDEVGPSPGQPGDFPVPALPGECGDIQLYVFG